MPHVSHCVYVEIHILANANCCSNMVLLACYQFKVPVNVAMALELIIIFVDAVILL